MPSTTRCDVVVGRSDALPGIAPRSGGAYSPAGPEANKSLSLPDVARSQLTGAIGSSCAAGADAGAPTRRADTDNDVRSDESSAFFPVRPCARTRRVRGRTALRISLGSRPVTRASTLHQRGAACMEPRGGWSGVVRPGRPPRKEPPSQTVLCRCVVRSNSCSHHPAASRCLAEHSFIRTDDSWVPPRAAFLPHVSPGARLRDICAPQTAIADRSRGWDLYALAPMRRYRLSIAYDGTAFCGWQRQHLPADIARQHGHDASAPPPEGRVELRSVQRVVPE